MLNCKFKVKDGILTMQVNLKKEFGLSKSGKTIIVASTKGNKAIEDSGCIIGLNVYKYPEKEE